MARTTRNPPNATQKLTDSPSTVSSDRDDEADDEEHEPVAGDPVPAGRESRVLLEMLLDLAEDPLFVLGERHRHHHHTFEGISQRASALGGWSRCTFPPRSASEPP